MDARVRHPERRTVYAQLACIGYTEAPDENMSSELTGIFGVGAALAGLILTASLWLG